MDDVSNYKQLVVLIQPWQGGARVTVIARTVVRGRRHDRALVAPPGIEIPLEGLSTLEQCFRAAAESLQAVADSE